MLESEYLSCLHAISSRLGGKAFSFLRICKAFGLCKILSGLNKNKGVNLEEKHPFPVTSFYSHKKVIAICSFSNEVIL